MLIQRIVAGEDFQEQSTIFGRATERPDLPRTLEGFEQALDLMLPVFHAMAKVLQPVTFTMIRVFGPRREREANGGNGAESDPETPVAETESAADDAISEEEGRELLQSVRCR